MDQVSNAYFRSDDQGIDWAISETPVPYPWAVAYMEQRLEQIHQGTAKELIWLLEHPPLYTRGVSAKSEDLLAPDRFPVFETERGGQYTYHGPGQRVAYVLLDLKARKRDVRGFVEQLEGTVIETLKAFNVDGLIRQGRVGVWVETKTPGLSPQEDKIAAIGLKLRKWISFHGLSLNVEPDLDHFSGIVPCGLDQFGVTSLVKLGRTVTLDDVDAALKTAFEARFGPVQTVAAPDGF